MGNDECVIPVSVRDPVVTSVGGTGPSPRAPSATLLRLICRLSESCALRAVTGHFLPAQVLFYRAHILNAQVMLRFYLYLQFSLLGFLVSLHLCLLFHTSVHPGF